MLKCTQLTKCYKDKCAVDKLSFNVREGEVFALLGSNGAGKTTTIKMILNLVKKDSGNIMKKQGIKIGYSPETPYFHTFLTGKEVLMFFGKLQKMDKKQLSSISSKLLNVVGLEDNSIKVKNYSKGMLQRLAIAQSLLGDPDFIILDEPTAGLDALGRIEIMELILNFKKIGKTILINSHILNDIERVCDRGIILKSGVLIYEWEKNKCNEKLEDIFISAVGGIKNDLY